MAFYTGGFQQKKWTVIYHMIEKMTIIKQRSRCLVIRKPHQYSKGEVGNKRIQYPPCNLTLMSVMCPISDSDFLFTSRFSWQQRVQHRVSEVRVKGKQECVVVAVQRGFIVLGTVSITRQAQQLSSGKVNATVWAQRDGDLGICPRGGGKSYALCTHTHKTHMNINICTFLQILKWCIFHKPVHSSFIQPWWIFNEKIKERGGGLPCYTTSMM